MLTAVLCYAQPLKNGLCTASEYFLKLPLSVTPIRIIPVIKRLRNLGRIQFIAKSSSIYTKICLRHKQKTFKDKDYCPIKIIKGLTDKGQFQYLTISMGPQEGTYLYATQFHSLR